MRIFEYIVITFAAILMVASCTVDQLWQGSDPQGEERVLTFEPRFEDFEAATKAIGGGDLIDQLLVQVYDEDGNFVLEKKYSVEDCEVQQTVEIPFFKNNEYRVYFWAYHSADCAYTIADGKLKNGVKINYPESTELLKFNSLEYLDAFYAVEEIDLSDTNEEAISITLTRPFAQVNIAADKYQLQSAKATKVEIIVSAATSYDFVDGPESETSELKFTFEHTNYFQDTEDISEGKVYLGTTYLFVPSAVTLTDAVQKFTAKVGLYDEAGTLLKEQSDVEIPLSINNRTNIILSDIEPAETPSEGDATNPTDQVDVE